MTKPSKKILDAIKNVLEYNIKEETRHAEETYEECSELETNDWRAIARAVPKGEKHVIQDLLIISDWITRLEKR